MKLSILIVNWNTKDLLIRCLNSIVRNMPIFGYEVIVVDNGSTDGGLEAARNLFGGKGNFRIISASSNLGFSRANNLAFKHSTGEYVLLLNPDTEIKHQALSRMVNYMENNLRVGILGPKLLNPDGTVQPSVRRFPDIGSSLLIFSYLHRLIRPKRYLMDDFDYDQPAEVDQVMGAALMTRRSIIETQGFLDENFWLWYEEVDFCKRVKRAGYQVIYYPEAVVMHYGGESFSQFDIYQRKKTLAKSLIYYFEKNGKGADVWVLKMFMPAVLIFAKILQLFQKALHSTSPSIPPLAKEEGSKRRR